MSYQIILLFPLLGRTYKSSPNLALVNMHRLFLTFKSFESSLKRNQRLHQRFKSYMAFSGCFLKIPDIAVPVIATASTEIDASKQIQEEKRNVAKDENTTVMGAFHYLHGN